MVHHFILTRFCLDLWQKDKANRSIDMSDWIVKRVDLFEKYCLPSIIAQTNKNFEWILLVSHVEGVNFEWLKERLKSFKTKCPQIKVAYVKPEYSWKFAYVFKELVEQRLEKRGIKAEDICLTTYFDNDDIIAPTYIEDVQRECKEVKHGMFISFDYGCQYFTELDLTTRIWYPNNHFITLVEHLSTIDSINGVRTCFGYGSHFLLERNKVATVHHIKDKNRLMWTEVVHDGNVDNDVRMTFDTKIISGSANARIRYMMRVVQQICRRTHDKFIPRKW